MSIPEFVNCSFCDKKLEYWKEAMYMSSPDDADDFPFCKEHWNEYYDKKRTVLEELFKYYIRAS